MYCKDELRAHSYQHTSFDFLGYTFRPRTNRTQHGRLFTNFSPAISDQARKSIRRRIRQWKIHLWSGATLASIAREINPVIRGWIQYYGQFMRSEVRSAVQNIDAYLVRWAMGKYKRLRGRKRRASAWLERIGVIGEISLFIGQQDSLGGLIDGSRMSREAHVRFCERPRGRVPWPTYLGGVTG